MKIAVIVGSFPTISETFIYDQIISLIELGHQVDIFAFNKSDEKIIYNEIIKYNLLTKVTYLGPIPKERIKRIVKFIKILIFYFPFYSKKIIKCLDYKKYGSKYLALNNLFILIYFLGKKYNVVTSHFGPNGARIIFLKDIYSKLKFITTFQGYDLSKEYSSGYYNELFSKGDLFLPVSEYFKNKLIKLGCPKEKIKVSYFGIDIQKFNYLERPFDFKNSIKLLTVSRLVEKKGIKYSLLAIAKIVKNIKIFEYTIIGDGIQRNELELLVNELDLDSVVKFTGSLEHKKVMKYFYESDVFILPSVTANNGDQEGIPTVLKEAMATGMPVISTYHSGIPELVVDEASGLLVPEKDSEALAQKLIYLIEHPHICQQMGRAGRKYVKEFFDLKTLNYELTKIYRNLISGKDVIF